jgi:hypothetical protein
VKFSIRLLDYAKLEAKQKYSFELARTNKLRDAVSVACALARPRAGQHVNIEIDLRAPRGGSKELADIYCRTPFDEEKIAARAEAKLAEIKQRERELKRITAFRDRYLRTAGDHPEWHRRWDILQDTAFKAALLAEDYPRADQRAAELGLVPNDEEGSHAA